MRILFVANHGCGDNQDEDAVAHALRQLGHEVICIQEKRRHRGGVDVTKVDANFCLFFKWPVVSELVAVSKRMPCAYWHFDMIASVENDPTLAARSEHRVQWVRDVLPHCVAGFHTDGNWCANACRRGDVIGQNAGKLIHLMQGMDERVAGFGDSQPAGAYPPILFAGMVNHGQRRAAHVEYLRQRYGNRFFVMGDGGPHYRKHGRELADIFASVKVVIAPDGPSTDLYWSNRVYNCLGLGGFLLHPYCQGLAEQYEPGEELTYYTSWDECDGLIDYFLEHEDERQRRRLAGHQATLVRHLYRHRAEELVRIVKERL